MSTVFLSYSSEQTDAATRIELSLKEDGHKVFRDRSSLPAGEAFDARIRAAVADSDAFVFLITRESVSAGRYTLTELKFAEEKWANPSGRVLPVMVEPVPKDAIPAYLRAVTFLAPKGSLTAEVAAAVALMRAPWWRRMLAPRRLVPALIAVLVLAGFALIGVPPYLAHREQIAEVQALMKQSQAKAGSGQYDEALKILDQAHLVAPTSRDVTEAQERLAMEWLRWTGLGRWDSGRIATLLDKTLPVLARGEPDTRGERLADLVAHTGWADYLRNLADGTHDVRTVQYYKKAADADPRNVYAHTMWGFEILRVLPDSKETIALARPHFSAALESGREREYVRFVELSALLRTYQQTWVDDPERLGEAIRVVDEMRRNGETRPKGWGLGSLRRKLWSIYHFGAVTDDRLEPLLAALPPTDHLAAFLWLYPADDLPSDGSSPSPYSYFVVLAQLQEHAGDRAGAVASYRRVLDEIARMQFPSSRTIQLRDKANAAIKRLSSQP